MTDQSAVTCDTADLAMFHRFLRTVFADVLPMIEQVPDGDAAQAHRVAAHVSDMADALHHHHEGEDLILWDRLEQRAPACAIHVAQMRQQHGEIAELLTALRDALPTWQASGRRSDARAVTEAIQALNSALDRHLGQEERDIVPVAATAMSQREWDRLAEHGRAVVPRNRQLSQLGFMLDSMAPDDRAAFLRTLPSPVRLLWHTVGRRRFDKYRTALIPVSTRKGKRP